MPSLGLADVSSQMDLLCLLGIFISFLCCVSFRARRSKAAFALLWILYFSLYQVGQTFLWFQWDILLLEAGFLTIFLAPDFLVGLQSGDDNVDKKNCGKPSPVSSSSSSSSLPPSSSLFLFLFRWLLFRLMFASGVVKLTSRCPTWWNLTALDWHYESQCIPTPLAWFFHRLLPVRVRGRDSGLLGSVYCVYFDGILAALLDCPLRYFELNQSDNQFVCRSCFR